MASVKKQCLAMIIVFIMVLPSVSMFINQVFPGFDLSKKIFLTGKAEAVKSDNTHLITQVKNSIDSLDDSGNVIDESVVIDSMNNDIEKLLQKVATFSYHDHKKLHLHDILESAQDKLQRGSKFIAEGDEKKADKAIEAGQDKISSFIEAVQDQKGKSIDSSDADKLITDANNIISNGDKRGFDTAHLLQENMPGTTILLQNIRQELGQLRSEISQLQSQGATISISGTSPVLLIISDPSKKHTTTITLTNSVLAISMSDAEATQSQNQGHQLSAHEYAFLELLSSNTLLQTGSTTPHSSLPLQNGLTQQTSPNSSASTNQLLPSLGQFLIYGTPFFVEIIPVIIETVGTIILEQLQEFCSSDPGSCTDILNQIIEDLQSMLQPQSVFSENFDESTLTGWSNSVCSISAGFCSIGQTTSAQGGPPPSPPNWGIVGDPAVSGGGSSIQVNFAKTFSVTTEGDYDLSAVLGTRECDICTITNQVYVDGSLVFSAPGTTLSSTFRPFIVDAQTTLHLLPGTHTIELGTNSDIAFSGSFTTWFDDVKIVPHSSSSAALVAPSLSISGGPYFSLQVNNTSINTTSGSTTVVPLKVIWNSGFSAEPVHTAFIGNTTSVIPSITSVTNTTSSQLFNVNLNVPSSTQTGNYVVGITISEPDGDFKVIPIFVKIQ